MALVTKAIKPKALDIHGMMNALQKAAQDTANDIELDFKLTTATWQHEVEFEKLVQVGPDRIEILVDTDDEIYRYVNDGTRKNYPIPRDGNTTAKTLRFQSVYTAKSSPGALASGHGGASGDWRYAKRVIHPGIEARNFDKEIAKMWKKKFRAKMENAMSAARKASGHAI